MVASVNGRLFMREEDWLDTEEAGEAMVEEVEREDIG